MRTIQITAPDGSIDPCAVAIVQAHMQFPDDQASIDDDIVAFRARVESGFKRSVLGKHMENDWRGSRAGGLYAGCILHSMVQFGIHRPEMKVGFNKSVFMAAQVAQRRGGPLEKRESTIKNYWSDYKNSAHLWAAFMLTFWDNGRAFPLDFLSLLDTAEKLIPLAAPHIEDWDPWHSPACAAGYGPTLEFEPPDPDDISLVKRYKAPAAIQDKLK